MVFCGGIPRDELRLRRDALHRLAAIDDGLTGRLLLLDTRPIDTLIALSAPSQHADDSGDDVQ